MIITYHGKAFFKLQFGSTTLAVNPVSKDSQHTAKSFGADVVLVSVKHPDMNGAETARRGDADPFIIDGPGAYEVRDIAVRGFGTPTAYGKKTRNTAYLIRMEDMHICYLGAINTIDLPKDFEEEIEDIDILFVPIGGDGSLSPKDAHKLAVRLEARVVIPMLYDKKSLETFLKEEGESGDKPVDKLTLKHKDLAQASGDIKVLKEE